MNDREIQRYENLRRQLDNIVRIITPTLDAEIIDKAVEAVNTLVSLQRSPNMAFSDQPREVLGETSDRMRIVYGEVGVLGFYHADPRNAFFRHGDSLDLIREYEYRDKD